MLQKIRANDNFKIRILLLLLLCILNLPQQLKAEDQKTLSKDPQWLALLHSEGNKSKIKPSTFFIAENGHKNPEAELIATLESFKDPNSKNHCLFPARFEWLKTKTTGLENLSLNNCEDLQRWYSAINPTTLTLIFASSFVNNPASAFGHTFVRFDQKNSEDLLSYTANYAAQTHGEDALTYAFKGIFGGYDGYFSVMPYYQKVKEYNDLENRDIWEYQLSLNQEEIRKIVLHLWELRNVPASYYYFDENCSYKILELLVVARPSLSLSEKLNSWVIPVDTVRAIEPLIAKATFRPSAQTLLKNRILHASDQQKSKALEIAKLEANLNLESQEPETLDLAFELITYRKIAGKLDNQFADKTLFEILKTRGANPKIDSIPKPETPSVRPEQGHGTAMLAISEGRRDGKYFSRLTARPALHDLLNPQPGYQKGAQIKFFEFALDATESEGLDLGYFTALDITSLTPVDDFFSPLSWTVSTGLKRNIIRERDNSLSSFLEVGFGKSLEINNDNLLYALLDSELRANNNYEHDFNPGAGIKTGTISKLGENFKAKAELQFIRFVEQKNLNWETSLSYAINKNSSIILSLAQQREFDSSATIGLLGYQTFFTPW